MSRPTDPHRQAYAFCAYCPKVCRFACPVSESTHSETTSTWGKMTEAFLTTGRKKPVEPEGSKALYACTGCMRCRSFCKHENEVGFALFSARSQTIDAGTAPEGARTTLKTFAEHKNPFGADLAVRAARFRVDTPVRFQLFPGCSSLVRRPETVEDALFVSGALGAPAAVSKASALCCGYPLYAAGDLKAFEQQAGDVAEALSSYPELVVLDPGCAYTLKIVYPRVGVELKPQVRTLYEVWADQVEYVPLREPMDEVVAYHDACHLGRGLGQYEQPRRLLGAAVKTVMEAHDNRAEGGCSGGGGLLPRTMPEVAVDIAARQAQRASPAGERVVTACPTSRRMFQRAGRSAEDLVSVLRRWLEGQR